tara:strand:- start:296 stop:487 length:192 start_codon:yes stop_codon:yes gene_type:complete
MNNYAFEFNNKVITLTKLLAVLGIDFKGQPTTRDLLGIKSEIATIFELELDDVVVTSNGSPLL